jgi:hypothetical protein
VIQRHLRMKTALAAAAIAGGTAIAAIGTAGPAVALFSPPLLLKVHTKSPATLAAKGTTVNVKLRETCAGARSGSLTVKLTERVGQNKVRGTGGLAQVLCTNSREKYLVQVTVKSGPAFKPGRARASSSLSACTTGKHPICGEQTEVRTIKLKN